MIKSFQNISFSFLTHTFKNGSFRIVKRKFEVKSRKICKSSCKNSHESNGTFVQLTEKRYASSNRGLFDDLPADVIFILLNFIE